MDDAVAVKFTSINIWDQLLYLKFFIQEKLPYAEETISTPTLIPVNGKVALTLRELTDHLINLKTVKPDNGNIKSKHSSRMGLHLNQSGSNLLTKNIISKLRELWKSLEHLSKPNPSTKSLEARNCNNEKKNLSEDFKMKPQSPGKVSINSHEVT